MSEPVISIDVSRIRPGRLEELKRATMELVEFVDANETRPLLYSVFFNEDDTEMTVLQVHPDSASMEFHMDVAGPAFRGLSEFLTLLRIDIYGPAGDRLLEQMRQKAKMLGNATLLVHERHAGVARLGVR
jgi:quinol monooxygenase YgiN